MSEDVVEKLFPLHNEDDLVRLRKTWVKAFNKPQPIGKVLIYLILFVSAYGAMKGSRVRFHAFISFLCSSLNSLNNRHIERKCAIFQILKEEKQFCFME